MLSLLPNLIFAASGLVAMGTLVHSWLCYRGDWAALHAGIAAGMSAGTVRVVVRDTTVHAGPRECAPATVIYHPGFAEKAAALPFQPGAIPARRPVLRAAA